MRPLVCCWQDYAARNVILRDNGIADYISSCSFGKMVFDREALTVGATNVEVVCTPTPIYSDFPPDSTGYVN